MSTMSTGRMYGHTDIIGTIRGPRGPKKVIFGWTRSGTNLYSTVNGHGFKEIHWVGRVQLCWDAFSCVVLGFNCIGIIWWESCMPWVVLSFSQLCHLLLCANLLAPSCWYLWHKLSTNLMGGSIVYSRTLSESRKMTLQWYFRALQVVQRHTTAAQWWKSRCV